MQARDFSRTVELLDAEDGDYAAYLGALARYSLKEYSAAETAAATLRAAFPDSPWARKALYLQAVSLVSQNKHQEAEVIRAFLAAHPGHPSAPGFASQIGTLYEVAGRPDEALAAFGDFIAGQNDTFQADEASSTPIRRPGSRPPRPSRTRSSARFSAPARSASTKSATMRPSRCGDST